MPGQRCSLQDSTMAMSPKDRTGMQFTYNQLNLPKTAIGGDQSISYRYDALGPKLKKQATVGGIVTEQQARSSVLLQKKAFY